MVDEATLVIKAETSQLVTADQRLNKINKTGKQTAQVQQQVGNSFRRNNVALQNTAFQLQDIVVQLEGGVAPSRALAQQLPQLLGGFGALGAVSGLVAGLGFSLAGPLVNGLLESTDSAEALDEALEALEDTIRITKDGTVLLSEEFELLAEKSRDVAEVQLKARLITATNAANAAFGVLSTTVEDFNSTLGANSRSVVSGRAAIRELAEEYGLATKEVKELAELTRQAVDSKAVEDVQALRNRITELALSSGSTTDKFTELAQAANEASFQFEKQKEIIDFLAESSGNAERAVAQYGETAVENAQKVTEALEKQASAQQAALVRAGEVAQREQDAAARGLDAVERQLASREQLIELNAQRQLAIVERNSELLLISAQERADLEVAIEKDKQARIEKLKQDELDTNKKFGAAEVAAVGDLLTLVANVSNAENKKQFERNKKLAIAGATIKGIQATVAAYQNGAETNIFLGAAYAAIAAAATGAQIAQIQNQQYPGRAIGGQVTQGQAYRVGEYGPETFIPASSGRIMPQDMSAANNSPPVEVVNNIQVIGGNSDAQVTTTTTQQTDRKLIQDIVVDLMGNQSSAARQALQRTSNVVSRGSR